MKDLNPEQRGERQFCLRLLKQMEAMQAFALNEYEAKYLATHRAEIRARLDALDSEVTVDTIPVRPAFPAASRKSSDRKEAV